MLNLENKIAIVTGCGSFAPGWGNGKAIATLFARQGATVIGVDLSLDAAQETQKIIAVEGHSIQVQACDVTKADQFNALIQDCLDRFGRIDILVNNVGRSEPGNPMTMDEDIWDQQIELNLKSVYLGCRAVLPAMSQQNGGSIINISSVAGMRFVGKDQVAYAAAKAALTQLTKVTAVSFAKHCVRLNVVVPGLMDTPLVQRLADRYAGGEYQKMVTERHAQVPMGRMGDAWDVAHTALFLASDESKYITGAEIVVDGGLTLATR